MVWVKWTSLLLLFLSSSLFFSGLALAQVTPDPSQSVPLSSGGLTQSGMTCTQTAQAVALTSLGLGASTSSQTYQQLLLGYNGTSNRNCFRNFVNYITSNNNNTVVNLSITGATGGPGRNITYINYTTNTVVGVRYGGTTSSGPHPNGPVPPRSVRITQVTSGGSNGTGGGLTHNIIVASVSNLCFTLPEVKTATGKTLTNVLVCLIVYWDPNTDELTGSFMTSNGLYINVNGLWEQVISTTTVSK